MDDKASNRSNIGIIIAPIIGPPNQKRMKLSRIGSVTFLSLILLTVSLTAVGQKQKRPRAIRWFDFSDSSAFRKGPVPLVQAYGPHSDSLSKVHGGVFYTLGHEYFPIKTAADYYLWFTRRYDFLFRGNVESYELFYIAGDNLSMATYISENYKGKRYPIRVSLSMPSNRIYGNAKQDTATNSKQQREYDKNVSDPVKVSKPAKKN